MPNSSISAESSAEPLDETPKKSSDLGSNTKVAAEDSQSMESPMFSTKVRAMMAQVDDSEMLRPDFDLTAYINRLFPTAQLDEFMHRLDEENKLKEEFISWFIGQQLAIYELYADSSEDVAWLDKIEERFHWFVNKLAEFERTGLAKVFPAQWEMGRKLAWEFCTITRQSLARMMNRRRAEIDWKLLCYAINHSQIFEQLLARRFPAKGEYNFDKIIWSMFDDHVDVFLAEQKAKLSHFLDECSARIRSGEEKPRRELNSTAIPLPSAASMFLLISKIITESTKLFAGPNNVLSKLLDLFRQCLRQFGHGCLSVFLPQVSAMPHCLSQDQVFFACCILATANWSAESTAQLQMKLKLKIENADLYQEAELFYRISNNALTVLVQDAEMQYDPSLQAMAKTKWSKIKKVGDESPYVSTIRKNLRASTALIRDYFADRRKYFAHFCLKLASNLVNEFLGALFKCRPISIAGAEQLLLDTHSLKTFLLSLPSLESSVAIKSTKLYTNTLNKLLTRAEMILKAVMADMTKPEEFVTHFARILPDSDVAELQRILEMRSIRKTDQQQIVQLYKAKAESQGQSQQPSTTASGGTNAFTALDTPFRPPRVIKNDRVLEQFVLGQTALSAGAVNLVRARKTKKQKKQADKSIGAELRRQKEIVRLARLAEQNVLEVARDAPTNSAFELETSIKTAFEPSTSRKSALRPDASVRSAFEPDATVKTAFEPETSIKSPDASIKATLEPASVKSSFEPNNSIKSLEIHADASISGLNSELERMLDLCDKRRVITWEQFSTNASSFESCSKLGEGTYGEVFKIYMNGGQEAALKVIPFAVDPEECNKIVNGDFLKPPSCTFNELLITRELSKLADEMQTPLGGFITPTFIRLIRADVVQGVYPKQLLEAWDDFKDAKPLLAENQRPNEYSTETQHFILIALSNGGIDLEAYKIQNQRESYSIFYQIALSLAIAEGSLDFEHRDLHVGNVLISACNAEEKIKYIYEDKTIRICSSGVKVSIIDFTNSRLTKDDLTVYINLASDEGLFEGKGDYQYDIYRLMKDENKNDWAKFTPRTNLLWLHYLSRKLFDIPRLFRKRREQLLEMFDSILKVDLIKDFLNSKPFLDEFANFRA